MKPHLENKKEFEELLDDYRISEAGVNSIKDIKLVLLVGPTGSGRNTIIQKLIDGGGFTQVVSDTTRPPRINDGVLEVSGEQYWFRSEKEILSDLKSGNMLEAAVIHDQQVSGTSLRVLKEIGHDGNIAINEVEPFGASNIYAVKPNTFIFFVVPPNFKEWIRRLEQRGMGSKEETRNRMKSALWELTMALENDYYRIVVNDSLDRAVSAIGKQLEVDDKSPGIFRSAEDIELLGSLKRSVAEYIQSLAT